ncbi:MAG TPA: D-alanyl-D-alanine carboxypeptidase [Chitinophagaceae bacterium]|nr:D-alanyl-D-alanine carboxypeptidase [Chitinophagaceae bacterium]
MHSAFILFLASCSVNKEISRSAKKNVLNNKALQTAHVGISIYDPAASRYLYNYQGDKYFVPASNTKLPTCYTAMKYLGDSLVGLRYKKTNDAIFIQATGDPTFLHPDFSNHPAYKFLSNRTDSIIFSLFNWKEKNLGSGWAWSDYLEPYMAERSVMPVYGNLRRIEAKKKDNYSLNFSFAMPNAELEFIPKYDFLINPIPPYLNTDYNSSEFLINWLKSGKKFYYDITRQIGSNELSYKMSLDQHLTQKITFDTKDIDFIKNVLEDTLHSKIILDKFNFYTKYKFENTNFYNLKIHSQPTDSVLKPMMHRSDNFFAEQMLLMVSNEMLGVMNDAKIIDTLLKTDFKDLPQKPRWVDGSGLSRYNLFTPQDLVAILNKMKNEFGMDRIKEIFPTGGEGTISSYYQNETGFIYGKTGTLSGVVAFSGFLYTKKGKLLIFSTLVNNHKDSATAVRRAIEKFLQGVRNMY